MARPTVILVPGITGSEIRYPAIFGLGVTVWCSPPALLLGGFSAMRLAVASEGLPAPARAASAGGPALGAYYGPLAAYLTARGWRVVFPVGDWRYPQATDAAALTALVRAESDAAPVQVVCHSRGGLLVRRVLGSLAATGDLGRVRRVVGLGVPHTGSLVAAAYVSGDNGSTRLVQLLANVFPPAIPARYLVAQVTAVTRSWPSLYELMPAPGNPWLSADRTAPLYVPASWEPSATRPVAAYLSAALANWSAVPPVPQAVDWIDVAGVGVPTAGSYPSMDELARAGAVTLDLDGDGTVPLASAAQSPRPRCITPTGHSSLPIDPRVWDVIVGLLADGTTRDLAVTGRVLSL